MRVLPSLSIREVAVPFVVLLAFWILLIPESSIPSVAIGAIVSAGTVFFCRDILFRRDELPLYTVRTVPIYLLLLLRLIVEVVKSNIDVARTVLSPELRIQPQFIHVPTAYRTVFNCVVHSQCITLTPGTISVDVRSNDILVHALTDKAAAGLQNNYAARMLKRIEDSLP